jgi:molybdopterin-guanine dinucleotide biosynthesis protein A
VVLLAGGKATRLGGYPKGLIELPGGETLVERLLRIVRSLGLEGIVVSANDPAPYEHLGLPVIADRRCEAGPLAGIEAALYHFADTADAVLVLSTDLSSLEGEHLSRLLSACAADRAVVSACVRTKAGEEGCRLEPLVAVVSTELSSALTAFLDQGGRRVRDFYGAHRPTLVPLPASAVTNINTPEDLAGLRRSDD